MRSGAFRVVPLLAGMSMSEIASNMQPPQIYRRDPMIIGESVT
jgi:hypothetical protein